MLDMNVDAMILQFPIYFNYTITSFFFMQFLLNVWLFKIPFKIQDYLIH